MSATENTGVQRHDVNPNELLVDCNIRLDTRLDGDFVASIKDHGVLMPIVAVRTNDGALRVRFGHRRTAAAIQAGLATVPVDVVGDEGSDDAAQMERVITQHAENAYRANLSVQDELNVVEQLSAFGLSASQINKRTRIKRATVDAAITVASSELAKKATERYDFLSLDQAAAVAEFESDDEAVKELVVAAKNGRFDHTVQRLRDERADRQAQAALLAELGEAGVTVIERPAWGSPIRLLGNIGTDQSPMTVETHASCPGHAAYLAEVWTDADEEEDDEDAELVWEPVYVCTDPVGIGHIELRETRRGSGTETPEAGDEAKREERRNVIANNKAWRSAESVRREWLSKFLERKTAPKDAMRFVIGELACGGYELRQAMERGHPFACQLLDIETEEHRFTGRTEPLVTALTAATDARLQVMAVGLVLAAQEDATGVHSWRSPSEGTERYLLALAGWGYGLSDVEKLITADSEAD